MPNRPFFSIITAVYNCEKYINGVINSVLKQECNDYEYIIVNDGSTDGTLAVIESFQDDRIKIITQENQWVYAAMNRGIKEAQGKYIVLVNADDLLHSDVLSIARRKIIENNYPDVVWENCYIHEVDENQKIIKRDKNNIDGKYWCDKLFSSTQEMLDSWVWLSKNIINVNPHNIYKRELMLKHPFRNDVYGADTLMNIDMTKDIKRSLFIVEPLVEVLTYPQPEMNISKGNKFYDYAYDMFMEITEKSIELLANNDINDLHEAKIFFYTQEVAFYRVVANSLSAYNCTYSIEEKVTLLMDKYLNQKIWEMASYAKVNYQLIAYTVNGLKRILENDSIPTDSEYYFLNHLIKVALKQEKPDEEKMKLAVLHEKNPYGVGSRLFRDTFGYDIVQS